MALLKVSGIELPQVRWSDASVPRTASLIAAMECQQKPGTVGILSHPSREIPPERGTIIGSIELLSTNPIPEVWKVSDFDFFGSPFHKGDIVMRIEGIPTPDFDSLIALTGGPDDGRFPGKIVGDRMHAEVERDGQPVQLHFQLAGLTSPRNGDLYPSGRFSGFPCVYSTDIFVLPEMCGGPVVDGSGQVVGIVISPANNEIETYVIPAELARSVSERLIKSGRLEAPLAMTAPDAPAIIRPARVGTAAPDFEVETLNGLTFQLSDHRGKMVVLCFLVPADVRFARGVGAVRVLHAHSQDGRSRLATMAGNGLQTK